MYLWECVQLCGVELVQLTVCGNQIILFPVFKIYNKACQQIGKLQMSHLSLLKTPVVHVSVKWGLSEALTLTIRHSHESNQIKANHHRLQRKLMHHSRLIILTEIHYIKYKNANNKRERKNEYYRNKRANECQEEKASWVYKRREADKVRKQKRLKHDLSPVQLFLKSVTGIAVLFCVLCLKFGSPDSFHYVPQDSALLSEVNNFIDECSNASVSKIPLCQLCFGSLKNCKMPAWNRFNI